MRKTTFWGLFVAAAVVVCACKKEEDPDVTKPVIAVNPDKLKITGNAGDTLVVSAAFSDDRALANAKIDVHDAFDGHDHKNAAQRFSFVQVVPLSGKSFVHDFKIPVASNAAAGPYHVIINCTDKEGNEAAFVEIALTLFHPEMAALIDFKVNGEAVGDEIEFVHSDSLRLRLQGVLKSIAAAGLQKAEFKIKMDDSHSHKTTHGDEVIFEKQFSFDGEAEFGFDFNAVAKYERDHSYALHVLLINKEEHRTMYRFPIHFKN
ncbi:MAG: DUF4625 domain-containing protein [Bacteroidia bacterium]|nr:DUF4625 domain-containing protein [Bacteroidia bacterium]MDW8333081.1 DUF4625 domain-containing protein [Bacteroidia bacterium]